MTRHYRVHDRIRLQTMDGKAMEKVHLIWPPSEERLAVLDLSYNGIAFEKPEGFGFVKDQHVEVKLEVYNAPPFNIPVIIRRETDKLVGAEIFKLEGAHLEILHGFIEPRVPGVQLRRVSDTFYDRTSGLTHWYRAPFGVELFIWEDGAHHVAAFEFYREEEQIKFANSKWTLISPRPFDTFKVEIEEILGQVDADPVRKVLHLLKEYH